MVESKNLWYLLISVAISVLFIGWVSSRNIKTVRGEPRFIFRQELFDGLALVAVMINCYLMCRNSWLYLASVLEGALPPQTEQAQLAAWLFAAVLIVVVNVGFLKILQYLSISVQEVKFAFLKREFDRRERIRARRERASIEATAELQELQQELGLKNGGLKNEGFKNGFNNEGLKNEDFSNESLKNRGLSNKIVSLDEERHRRSMD